MISMYVKKILSHSHKINMIQTQCAKKNYTYSALFFPEIDDFERSVKGRNKISLTFVKLKNISLYLRIFSSSIHTFRLYLIIQAELPLKT